MGCIETDNDERLFTKHHIIAWFNFAKTLLKEEYCLCEQVLWRDKRKFKFFGHDDVQKI